MLAATEAPAESFECAADVGAQNAALAEHVILPCLNMLTSQLALDRPATEVRVHSFDAQTVQHPGPCLESSFCGITIAGHAGACRLYGVYE